MRIRRRTQHYIYSKPMKPWQGVLFGSIFTIIGIGILLVSISNIKSYNQKNETYTETNAIVVGHAYNSDGLEADIVEYTVAGKTYRKQSNIYSSMPKSEGTLIAVKYNPNDPSDAIWVDDGTNAMLPLIGSMFVIIGIITAFISAKKMKNEKESLALEQSNGLYNNADIISTMPNNQNLMQQNFQSQQQANQQQTQTNYAQNTGYSNDNQNN